MRRLIPICLTVGLVIMAAVPASAEPTLSKVTADEVTLVVGALAYAGWGIDVAYCTSQGFDVDHTFTVSFKAKESTKGGDKGFFEWYEDGDDSTVYSFDYVEGSAWFGTVSSGFELAYQQNLGHLDDVYGCFHAKAPNWSLNPPVAVIFDGEPSGEDDMFAVTLTDQFGSATLWLDIVSGDIKQKLY